MMNVFFSECRAFTLMAFVIILSGCGPVMAVPPASSVDAPATLSVEDAYRLAPGDAVKLTVYGEETLTNTYQIDPRGEITLPLAGEIKAEGLTRMELEEAISAALVEGQYFAKPSVAIDAITLRPFYILGEVKAPGSYPYQPSLDVFKAIATAGGYSPRAARGLVLIDRQTQDGRQRLNANESTPILPGDSITVRERIF